MEGHALAQEMTGGADHDGGQHQLNALRLQGGDVAVAGEVRLADHPPFALAGKLQLCGQVEARPLALTLDLNGYLSRFYVNAVATQGVVGLAQAVVIHRWLWCLMKACMCKWISSKSHGPGIRRRHRRG